MGGVAITEDLVQEAVRGARYPAGRRPDMPLLHLEVVTEHLRDRGADFSPASRWDALTAILRELVEARLVWITPEPPRAPERRGSPPASDADHTAPREPEVPRSPEGQAWYAVYHWAFAPTLLAYKEIGRRLGIGKSTAEGREELVRQFIAEILDHLEQEARRRLAAARVTTPAPLSVAEEAATYRTHRIHAALTMLWDATIRRVPLPTLTPGEREAIATYQPRTMDEYLLCRIGSWQDRDPFDQSFVDLSLFLDDDGVPGITPPYDVGRTFHSLEVALADLTAPLLVVVGDPGSGKTTLLAHLEQEVAAESLRGSGETVPMVVRLAELPVPWAQNPQILRDWLDTLWAARNQHLPRLAEFVAAGRLLLLLDGLNELPHADRAAYAAYVALWRECAHELIAEHPGNRVVFSCRTLDYTIPLSSTAMPVPRLKIKPLGEEAIRQYLARHLPAPMDDLWGRIEAAGLLDVLRVPYHLRLFTDVVVSRGEFPTGQAGLFATFVRHRLRGEVGRPNLLFFNDHVLVKRDSDRLMQSATWTTEWQLPENSPLIPSVERLARQMHESGCAGQVDGLIAPMDRALTVLGAEVSGDPDKAYDLLTAGVAVGVLDNWPADDTVAFTHQQMQAYFVGRTLAVAPQPELAERPWRRDVIAPTVEQLMEDLHPAEPLPPLDQTGWEEATILASEMADDPTAYVAGLMDYNLALAGRCAAVPAIRRRLTAGLVATLQDALQARSRDRSADLRDRLDCARVLGSVGDLRFQTATGPHGKYVMPPMAAIAGGVYPIGFDEPTAFDDATWDNHAPRHDITLNSFQIGRYPVTNAEWAWFMNAGGYEDDRWWADTKASRDWWNGVGTADAIRQRARSDVHIIQTDPDRIENEFLHGRWTRQEYEYHKYRAGLEPAELEAHLAEKFPDGPVRQPRFWTDARFNQPTQPVVGISWFEARAYCAWLSAQSRLVFRLPREVEFEAAARGSKGRLYAYGNAFAPLAANTLRTRLRSTAPVGCFPDGDTPEGVSDMGGNALTWTSTIWGTGDDPESVYPYAHADRFEAVDASPDTQRIVRGGSWGLIPEVAQAYSRFGVRPGYQRSDTGLRLVCNLA